MAVSVGANRAVFRTADAGYSEFYLLVECFDVETSMNRPTGRIVREGRNAAYIGALWFAQPIRDVQGQLGDSKDALPQKEL